MADTDKSDKAPPQLTNEVLELDGGLPEILIMQHADTGDQVPYLRVRWQSAEDAPENTPIMLWWSTHATLAAGVLRSGVWQTLRGTVWPNPPTHWSTLPPVPKSGGLAAIPQGAFKEA